MFSGRGFFLLQGFESFEDTAWQISRFRLDGGPGNHPVLAFGLGVAFDVGSAWDN